MPKYNRKIIAVLSDTHGGHKLGLCNPNVKLKSIENADIRTFSPEISETQNFMWETYEWGVSETSKLAEKDDIILLHDGDPTHGKAGFLETMTTRMADQIPIAVSNLSPLLDLKNVKVVRFAAGTGLHEFGEGSAALLIAENIRGKYPKVDVEVVYHGLLDIGGFLIDYAHHGPFTGSRIWLAGNELRYYLRSIMMGEIMEGRIPPHLILRGHYHVYRKEYLEISANGELYESWAFVLPGFTFKDDYTRRATRSEFKQTVGMMAFEVVNGRLYASHKFTKTVDIRTKEII